MESLLAFEAVAAASIALATVAAAAAFSTQRGRKRSRDDESETTTTTPSSSTTTLNDDTPRSPSRKKQRRDADEDIVVPVDALGVPQEVVIATLQRHARGTFKNKIIYTFLDDAGKEVVNYSVADVDAAARRIAATLQRDANVQKGDRVMLCFPPGLDFALAFWGCLYAGAIGIPVYPPYPGTLAKDLPKFNRMVSDSGARVILTNRTYHLATKLATVKSYFSANPSTSWPSNVTWITTDSISEAMAARYDPPELTMDDVAFFQYSSGSTSAPKAVMISHRNLRAQLCTWDSIVPSDTLVSWLPSYHDMGLVGFIITPGVFVARCVSMSPISFIKDPALWMRVASQYRATHVCAPNFGYALAARKTTDAQAQRMDLSTLKQTICAAEPIRVESLDTFTAKFKCAGFDPRTFNCGYGLAEVTLVCTGQNPRTRELPAVLRVDKTRLEAEKRVVPIKADDSGNTNIMTLVGCGKAMPTFTIRIVDPETLTGLPVGRVGEIWVSGPSVATGYWNRPGDAFASQLDGKSYLRTGDMGFLHPTSQELFVTGRLKDLIIIRGRNVCPQDVEATVESAHPDVRPGCVAAFSIEKGDEEALVVVAEVKNGSGQAVWVEICREINRAVLGEHQLRCEAIVLLRQKTIPKTTSGKIQRSAAKSKFLTKTLPKPVYEYVAKDHKDHRPTKPKETVTTAPVPAPASEVVEQAVVPAVQGPPVKTPEEILAWLLERIAQEVASIEDEQEQQEQDAPTTTENEPKTVVATPRTGPVTVDPTTPWAEYGLDSVAIVGLSSELGEFLGCVVPPSAFFQYDTPAKLAVAPGLATGELEATTNEMDSVVHGRATTLEEIPTDCFEIASFPEVQGLFAQMKEFEDAGLKVPYLETLTPEKRKMINFNTYNYLGNASNSDVAMAAKHAIDTLGTTMSSSPIVGQHHVAVELETALCQFFQAEAATLFVGGWVSNVTTIDALVGKGDLILCDALNHDSCVTGQRLSGATILPFPHNDTEALERMLSKIRMRYRRALIVIEGVYSMDGDLPNLPEMIRIKKQYKCVLFLDEAHSFGTMGKTGRGLCEHFDSVDPRDVDVRMGTMSKALGSVGGFILGSTALAKYLKHCAGGFVFSVGLSPAHSGAALKSLQLMTKSPHRTLKLQERSSYFYDLCLEHSIPMGPTTFRGAPVVVVIIGSTIATAMASQFLAQRAQVNVKPIVYPAVEEGKCRLRFFISNLHTKKQLEHAVTMLAEYLKDPERAIQEMMKPTPAGQIADKTTVTTAAPVAAAAIVVAHEVQEQPETGTNGQTETKPKDKTSKKKANKAQSGKNTDETGVTKAAAATTGPIAVSPKQQQQQQQNTAPVSTKQGKGNKRKAADISAETKTKH